MAAFEERLARHAEAAGEFATTAMAGPEERWTVRPKEGKWCPAEITDHLIKAYDTHLVELRGGPGLRVRTPFFRRMLYRMVVLPKILREGFLPRGVPAPREVLPTLPAEPRRATVERFTERAREFETAARERATRGTGGLTHPYLGPLMLDQSVRFVEVHVRHHRKQLSTE
ncbi:MAG: hypothetical protein HOP28_00190 [Gemmatimonadales bacterium]|nr:hypothetical protein [Gemmatimonadales bacterium]